MYKALKICPAIKQKILKNILIKLKDSLKNKQNLKQTQTSNYTYIYMSPTHKKYVYVINMCVFISGIK